MLYVLGKDFAAWQRCSQPLKSMGGDSRTAQVQLFQPPQRDKVVYAVVRDLRIAQIERAELAEPVQHGQRVVINGQRFSALFPRMPVVR